MANFYLDILAVAVVFIAGIVGMCRGFFASLLSLLGFVGTFMLSYLLTDKVLGLLNQLCGFTAFFQGFAGSTIGKIFATVIAFALTFFAIKVIIFILNHTIGLLFKGKSVGGMNKVMGGILGLCKGVAYVAIILVAVNIASLVPSVKQWTTTAFQQTYFIGEVYNWVGGQLSAYLGNKEQPEET